MEKQRWCLFGWSVYPKDGIRLLLCGWLGFGAFGSWGAYAAPPSSSLRVQILRARKDAFRIRAYEKQIWDIERWFADEPADQKATEKKIAETTDKKSAAIWKKSLRLRLENTKRNQALAQKMRRYLRYLESREQLIGKQRWRGHLYYHPTRGLLKGKAEGAELIVPVEAWRTHCVQQKPYAYDPPKERPLRVLAWGKSKWWVKEFQVAHREQPKPMHPERRYLYISSPSQYDLCRPRPFFLWDMNTQT